MRLSKEIFQHAAIYSFASVMGRLISFVMLPFYADIFRAEGYGVIALIDATLGVLSIMFASGFHVAILAIYHEESDGKKGRVISTAIRLVWGGGLAAIVIPMIFSTQLSRIVLGGEQYSVCFLLALITFLIDVGGQSASTSMIIKQQSVLYSVVNLIKLVLGLALNIWLVIIIKIGLIGVFITSLGITLVGSGAFLFMAIKEHGIGYDKEVAKKLLRFQLPSIPGDLFSFIARQVEVFLIRFVMDIRAVGVLEMAHKFPPLLTLFISHPFTSAWRTKAFEIAEQHQQAPRIIARMFTKYLFVMVFAGIVLAVSMEDLLKIMTPPEFWEAAWIARIEIVTTIMAGANSLLAFGLQYRKRTGIISAVKIAMAVIKFPLAFLMITRFHLVGAAYSALIIEAITICAVLHQSQKHYRIDYEYSKLIVISSYGLLICLLIVNDVVLQLFDLTSMRQLMTELVMGVIGLVPFAGEGSGKLLKIVLDRQDSLISLVINICSSLMFLIAVPLLARGR
jgi:O-antigen/teichoic acid export membrane protein